MIPMAKELNEQLSELQTELKTYVDKAAEEKKESGTMLTSTKDAVIKLQTQVDAMDLKLATKLITDQGSEPTLYKTVKESESIQRLLKDRRGSAVLHLKGRDVMDLMSRKSIISATTSGTSEGDPLAPVGVATTGVLQIDRTPGITAEARAVLRVRDLLPARPTTMQVVDFVKVTTPLSQGSPVPEASIKPENALQFTSISEKVRLIATWIPATKQVLDDFVELMGFIQSSLPYYINLEEELQLLAGDDTGENLHGLLPQAQIYAPTFLNAGAGWNFMDVIGTAIQQINANKEIDPTFVILNTNDWWTIRLTKDSFGRYILGDPQSNVTPMLFGLNVVYTTTMPPGQFLVGNGNQVAVEIRDRMEMQVEISTENADYFVRNLVAIRAEKRMALLTKRPNSFVSGTFTASPSRAI
jgi:HK97 family phage major capsid protein